MSRKQMWDRWLQAVGWILVVFGLVFAVFNQTSVFDLAFNQNIDPVFSAADRVSEAMQRFQAWIYGVLGATIAGWGVFVVFLARNPFRKREIWAWKCIFVGIFLWFVVDTGLSAAFGVYFNVIFNCVLAVLVYVPLFATRREFE